MNAIFHNDLAKEKYTRFWLILAPLFTVPLIGVLFLIWQELRGIRKEIQNRGGKSDKA